MLCFLLLLCLQKEQHKDLSWMAAIQLPPYWIDVTFGARDLRLCRVTYQSLPNVSPLVVTHSIIIKEDFLWVLHVNGHPVDPMNVPSIQRFSPLPGSDTVSFLLSKIDNLRICPCNPEGKYVELGKAKKNQQFLSEEKNVVAYVDRNACVVISDQQYASTVTHPLQFFFLNHLKAFPFPFENRCELVIHYMLQCNKQLKRSISYMVVPHGRQV